MLPLQKSLITTNRDNATTYLSEHLTLVLTRAHLNGIKTVFKTIASPLSSRLLEFIERVEFGLEKKFTDQENLIVESYITDHLNPLVSRRIVLLSSSSSREKPFAPVEQPGAEDGLRTLCSAGYFETAHECRGFASDDFDGSDQKDRYRWFNNGDR